MPDPLVTRNAGVAPPEEIIFPSDPLPARDAPDRRLLEEYDVSTPERMAAHDAIGHGADRAPDDLVHWRIYLPHARRPVIVRAVLRVLRAARPRTRRPRSRRRSTRASRAGPSGDPDPAGHLAQARRETGHLQARPPP
jgi:hypothetical protein